MTRPLFWLYRPTAPSLRAQSIQVVHAAHAMASRGHPVTLAVQRPSQASTTPEHVLDFYGLAPNPLLALHVLPPDHTPASLWFRGLFALWVLRNGRNGIAIARSKRYAIEARRRFGRRFRLVVEAHEVDSRQDAEKGADSEASYALERGALAQADAVVCNCPGTLELLRDTHRGLPPAIAIHNATHAARVRHPNDPGEGAGYVGSVRSEKDLLTLARAAALAKTTITLVGPQSERIPELVRVSGGKLRVEEPLAHRDVPDRLARFRTLLLPLGKGTFGEKLTSPLKLWDYLAVGRPIVGADTAALRDAADGAFLPYQPGRADALAAAIDRVDDDEPLRASLLANAKVRTWDQRAAEYEAFLDGVLR